MCRDVPSRDTLNFRLQSMSINSATQSLVDQFRSQPTLRAGSLITTVFGDAIAPRGGTVWIGSLIGAMADFGISERLVRTSVFRLSRDGWLHVDQLGRRSYYSLTDDGAQKFEQATQRIYGEPRQSWSGEWCLVLLAGLDPTQKERIKKELGWQGFAAISSNVLACPGPETADLEALFKRMGVAGEVVVMQGHTLGKSRGQAMRDLVQRSWNLRDIDARYLSFVGRFRPVLAAARKARKIDAQRAFQARTLLIQEYRKVLLRDPLLPGELLPGSWHGARAYQLCRNLYREIYARAEQFLSEQMETADGALPPPSPEFFERFGGLRD